MISFLPQIIFAQNISNPALGDFGDMSATEFLGKLIPSLISLGLVIGAIIFLFFFLMGAISWITSGGDKMKMEQARSKVTTALIGLIVLLSFVAILNLMECFFGIGLRQIEVGPFNISFTESLNCSGGSSSSTTTTMSDCGCDLSTEKECKDIDGTCIGCVPMGFDCYY